MSNRKTESVTILPIYRLAAPQFSDAQLEELATRAFKMDSYTTQRISDSLRLSTATKLFDVNLKKGSVWVADRSQLWNPDVEPRLIGLGEAEGVVRRYLEKYALLPTSGGDIALRVERISTASTCVATFNASSKKRQDRPLDVHISLGVQVAVPSSEGASRLFLPVLGEIGKIGVSLGNEGQIIAYNGAWRHGDGVETQSQIIPQEESDARFRKLLAGLRIESFESSLAYQAFALDGDRTYLCPVWIYQASAWFGDRVIPLRNIPLPATEFGPELAPQSPQPPRSKRATPAPWAKGVPEDYKRRTLAFSRTSPYEAGTSWIGLSGGLHGSQNNAKGFCDELRTDGWNINFNWGDQNAWESDWRRNDDDWVDAADFVFYTGHADGNGWVLSSPDDGRLDYTEVGSAPANPGDLYGQQDLEWVIVAACGPLEDDVISAGGGDVFDRWDGAFDGLHLLLGYGSVTNDNEDEGKRVIQYARNGSTLIDAWFRTGREIQPSTNGWTAPFGPTVWVGVMYAYGSGQTSPYNDHLWGHGSVAPDPKLPDTLVAIWTPC